jgi:chorismate dehydratase
LHTKVNELNKRIKVGAVSYLNTKPLLHGIRLSSGLLERIELIEDYPSKIAQLLLNNEIDVGLIPVAVIPQMKEHFIITDYCIGSTNEVASVAIFSEEPLEKCTTLLLDYQSRTSVNLAKVLLKYYWKKELKLLPASENFIDEIKGTTAAVVIGDRALQMRKQSKYIYDLSLAWKQYTDLPFMFAAWVANKKLPDDFIDAFNRANAYGVHHLDEVLLKLDYPYYDLKKYYTDNISYELNDEKRKALELFLSLI